MQKPKQKPRLHEESVEAKHSSASVNGAMSDISNDVLNDLWKNLLGGSGKTMSEQLLGASKHTSRGGDLHPGEAAHLKKKEEKAPAVRTEAHMEYFRGIKNADIAPKHQEDANFERQVNDIRMEIKKLISESKQLETTFKSIQIEQRVVKAGVYHQTLLTFIKSLIHSARVSLKEGSSWMNTAKGKKKQQGYQEMAKKHGTSFTMNNERTVATQTG